MKKCSQFFVFLISCLWAHSLSAQPQIIFDTDFGGDADDLGALVMLHNLVEKEECNLLAVMCWSTDQYVVPAVDAVNRFYHHPDIPIGVRKAEIQMTDWNHSKPIAEAFPYELTFEKASDATLLYRKILAAQEDHSLTIVTVGPLKNIQNLLQSKPDAYSPLNGKALIEQKVKEFVIMGGKFPSGEKEWNFDGGMAGVTQFVLENITVPITFSGFEVGVDIKTGAVFNQLDPHTPLYIGFMHFSQHAPWMKSYFKGKILDNSTYDQTAVLYAVRSGLGEYWEKITGGYCKADPHGGNTWVNGEVTNHAYLKLIVDHEDMETLIEAIMLNDF